MAKDEGWLSFPRQFSQLSQEVDRLFDEIITRPWGAPRREPVWNPSIDLCETPESFILEADLPGMKMEDVKVEVQGNDLVLQGKRSSEQSQRGGNFHCQERHYGSFIRRLTLPVSVNRDKIRAEFNNGVLRIILPKLEEKKEQS
jgi:HSP20 family protein